MSRRAAAVFLLTAATLAGACSSSPSPSPNPVEVAEVRQQNQGTNTSGFSYAVGVCVSANSPGACGAICSGTLIAPNLVLTARHCVDNHTGGGEGLRCGIDSFTTRSTSPATTFVTTSEVMATATWRSVFEIRTPPTTETCSSDIALLVLNNVIPAGEATPADVLAFGPMSDHSRYSTEIAMIGYGLSDPTVGGSSGRRRILEHVAIDCIVGDPVFTDPFCKSGGTITLGDGGVEDFLDDGANFQAGWGGCSGDSGSGAFEQRTFTSGKPLVMGVLSRSEPVGNRCLGPTYTRTDAWQTFLVQGVTAARTKGGYPLPAWASGPTTSPQDAGITAPGKLDGGADATSTAEGGANEGNAEKGAECTGSADCASGACVAIGSGPSRCVEKCSGDTDCSADEICSRVEEEKVCLTALTSTKTEPGPKTEGGCAIASAPGVDARDGARNLALALAVLLAAAVSRRAGHGRRALKQRFAILASGALASAACGGSEEGAPVTTTTKSAPSASWVQGDPPPDPEPEPDAGPAAKDAGPKCPPAAVPYLSGGYLPRKPPRASTLACRAGETTTVVQSCITNVVACHIDPGVVPCYECLTSLETDATYSIRTFLTPPAEDVRLNFRGYALRKGATEACGNAIEDYAGCLVLACTCAASSNPAGCYTRAKTAACKSWSDGIDSACASGPSQAAAAFLRPIVERGNFDAETDAIAMAKAFCGGT